MRKIADENAMHQSIPFRVKDSGMHVHYPTCCNTRAALERYEEAQKEYENFGRFSDFLRAPIYHSARLATIDPATGNNRENPHQILDTAAKTQLLDNRKVPATANPWIFLFHDGFYHSEKKSTILTKHGGPTRPKGSFDLGAEDWRPTSGGEYLDELGESLRTCVELTWKGTTLSECAEGTCCLAGPTKTRAKLAKWRVGRCKEGVRKVRWCWWWWEWCCENDNGDDADGDDHDVDDDDDDVDDDDDYDDDDDDAFDDECGDDDDAGDYCD